MSKRKLEYECPYAKYACAKEFKQDGMNDGNLATHAKFCLYGKRDKKGIASYFQKGGCNDGASCSGSSGSGKVDIATIDECDVMILDEANVTDTNVDRTIDNDNDVRVLESNAAVSSSFTAEKSAEGANG